MATYYLSENVGVCIANGRIVFLNIVDDEYLCLDEKVTNIFKDIVEKKCINLDCGFDCGDAASVVENLLEKKILQDNPVSVNKFNVKNFTRPQEDLSEAPIFGNENVKILFYIMFIRAFLSSVLRVSFFGFGRTLRYYKNNYPAKNNNSRPTDLKEAIRAFRAIRVFFYTAKDHCYFDCLVVMNYLIGLGFSPHWIFGVRMEPFYAHCWVQVDRTIVTDYLGATIRLKPILIV